MTPLLANERHELFAQGIARGLTQEAAYREAGYEGSPDALMANASRLIRDDRVAARVAELNAAAISALQAKADEAVASASWIVEKAVEVVDVGLAAVPVRGRDGKVLVDSEGEPRAYEAHDLRAVTSALSLLAKRHKEFSEKHVVSGDPEQPVIVERRTRSTK